MIAAFTITITWWMICIALFFIPFIYAFFRKSRGQWDFEVDLLIVLVLCWTLGVGLLVGKLLF